jgi:hypothetical protein
VRRAWVYDIETLTNCFVVVFIAANSDEERVFVIHSGVTSLRDDRHTLYRFITDEVSGFCGFNSIDFDDKILKWILSMFETEKQWGAYDIYRYAQEIISEEVRFAKGTGVRQRDLYRLHHFDNQAKATSLKWIQCHLNMELIQEMPIEHYHVLNTLDEIETVIKYCRNDVVTTKALLKHPKTQELIQVRDDMEREYHTNFMNSSNSSMGERIFLRSIPGGEDAMPLKPDKFKLDRVIFDYVRFHTPEFQQVLEQMRQVVVDPNNTKKKGKSDDEAFSFSVNFRGMKYDFGLGGLHAARPNTMWEEVYTVDVKSYYPNLSIKNNVYPRHIGPKFVITYERLFDQRDALPKGSTANKALKEALNSVFGKSNSQYSKLYDPVFTFTITVNGQLLLAMLCEAIERLNAGTVIMANTDGIEIIPKDMALIEKITSKWQEMTKLTLESDTYSTMLVRDVNNYIAQSKSTGKLKPKGVYELEREFHKDPSMRIVPTVIHEWFKNGRIESIESIYNRHKDNLNLFFLYARAKTGSFVLVHKDGSKIENLPKTIRYIITETGYVLRKKTDKKSEKVHSDAYVSVFNDLATLGADEIPIDHRWYLREIKSLIEFGAIEKLTLF